MVALPLLSLAGGECRRKNPIVLSFIERVAARA
jgi:hypothetical protein